MSKDLPIFNKTTTTNSNVSILKLSKTYKNHCNVLSVSMSKM